MPFTVDEFFGVFVTYNQTIWPAQIAFYLFGITAVYLVFKQHRLSGSLISFILAFMWLWNGALYHLTFFSRINAAARVFGGLFLLQGLLFFISGTVRKKLTFEFQKGYAEIIGLVFVIYAMLVYPLLGLLFGHTYPAQPMFGVAPCPTTIFTFGMLLFANCRIPWYLVIIPFLWSLIGMSAAVNLRVPEDYGLFVAGVAGTVIILLKNRSVSGKTER